MNCILVTVAIEDAALDPMGAKEAVAMALEPLGGVQVLQVDIQEPEQMSLAGTVPGTRGSDASGSCGMDYCVRCAHYQKQRGQDESGRAYWGVCKLTDNPVYRMSGHCKDWVSYI